MPEQMVKPRENYSATREYARSCDQADVLKGFREEFLFPVDENGEPLIYLCGNSLGLQPKQTAEFVRQELDDWARLGVEGHTEARHPWMPYHEFLTTHMAEVVGALPEEVVIMNGLTANLHLMMVSFYRPTADRYKVVIEKDAFPSDRYAVESQLRFHGFDPSDALLEWSPPQGEELCRLQDLEHLLATEGEQIALLMLGNTNYYTGQFYPIGKITEMGHAKGCLVGFDLAHGAGNILPNLHANGPDFAVWCTYKYLNSGPGSLGGVFVHQRHGKRYDLPRFAGWWGHNKDTRFNMRFDFDPMPGAEGWQLSNPPILSMAAIRSSLDLFSKAGMPALREKSKRLTGFLEYLIDELKDDRIGIITPRDPEQRGCQLSIQVKSADRKLHERLSQAGVVSDWREPDVIRVAPAPLYNSFEDVYEFVQRLNHILRS